MATISARDYVNDNNLLELVYTPFASKIEIVDSIIQNVRDTNDGKLDHVSLSRVMDEIVITASTNIDMTINDEETNLGGYDLLVMANKYSDIINKISDEYNRYKAILSDRLKDIELYEFSIYAIAKSTKMELIDQINYVLNTASQAIQSINSEEIIKMITDKINEEMKERDLSD